MNLRDKTVLITGGAKRVGQILARAFADKGARVLIHYRKTEPHRDFQGRSYQADLSKVSEIRSMAKNILNDVGVVDVLIHNASAFYSTPFQKTNEADWNDLMSVNLKAPFFLSQALVPAMKKKGEGRIIHIADVWGLKLQKNYLLYSLTKAGLISLTEGLAKEVAPQVLVTAICPGLVLSPEELGRKQQAKLAKKNLLGRWGKPEDVARMAVFLAESNFITGSCHEVDGGERIQG